ncbi:MAG: peptidylprolyl isomerase [Balneolaceae bacterium]|nr:peptidylprolyl isomerase [Balneolaceae bacterium]
MSCSSENNKDEHVDFKVLYEVNGIERTVFDFETAYVEHLIKTGRNDTKNERYGFLNQQIDRLLLAQAASQNGLLDHPKYGAAIRYQQQKSMIDFYFVDEMEAVMEPLTDEEIRLAYAKRQRTVYVRQLFSTDVTDLEEPYQRLQAGEDFVDVANDFYNTEKYDSLAGYIGPISYFGVEDAFAEAAYSTNQNEFTEPVRSRYGYHIIYVEYIEFPALLTEDDYQYRKQGVSSQLRLRKQELISNDYIRTKMESLNVQPDRENLNELREIILNLDGDAIINNNPQPENNANVWTDERLEQLEAAVDPNLLLATYELNGERIDFRAEEYLKWLPFLAFQESKVRTGASVGRAMRNEVLYQQAMENEYSSDERVQNEVEKRGYDMLADLYQYQLTREALEDTSSIAVPISYRNRLINNRNVLLKAEYWKIPAENLESAEFIKAEVISGDIPESFDAFTKVEYQVIDPGNDDFELIKKGIEEMPVLAHSQNEGWMVLYIIRKDLTEVKSSTDEADIESKYKVYDRLKSEIDGLRESATITIDTALFDSIYEVWKQKEQDQEES